MAEIELQNVTKVFSGDVVAIDDVSLSIGDGEFIALVGPSGCGKSTLLRAIAGLEEVTSGEISIGGRDVTDLAPRHRDIAMVFQSYALYPHMSVRQNLGYGLKVRRMPKAEIRERVDEIAELLGLDELLERKPAQLSGGQRQRVAMGRAIVREPQAFLMDEPLSNLDAKLRVGMRASLAQLHQRLGVTTVYVTHDQVEAMTLGQRVAVMKDGHILQVDTPQALYEHPRDLFVAGFIGSPAMNLVEATVDGDGGRVRTVPPPARPDAPSRRTRAGRVILGIRPETFEDAAFASSELPTLDVEVVVLEELGSDAHVFFRVDATRVAVETLEGEADDGADLVVERGSLLNARVDPRTTARSGPLAAARGRPARFHFFDPETGASLSPAHGAAGARSAGGRLTLDVLVLTTRSWVTMPRVTKQAETRDLVLDLIEQLAVGDAIPSERQLSADFGVSRLTVRAALDDLVREGYLVRRHGSGTFVSEPKIAQELTMTSFTDDMRAAGCSPRAGRSTCASRRRARASVGSSTCRPPSRCSSPCRLRLADGESMAIETVHIRASHVPGLTAADLEEQVVLRAPPRPLRDRRRRRRADDRADRDRRGRVAALGVPLHSPGVSVRARHALGGRRDRRVRRVDLPRRPVPARHLAVDSAGAAARTGRDGRVPPARSDVVSTKAGLDSADSSRSRA